MTPFAIILYGQCCRRHVEGQAVVSDISVVRSSLSFCSLCSEFNNNNNLLLRLLTAVLGTCILLHITYCVYKTKSTIYMNCLKRLLFDRIQQRAILYR